VVSRGDLADSQSGGGGGCGIGGYSVIDAYDCDVGDADLCHGKDGSDDSGDDGEDMVTIW
jgi:hypothetical protein